MAFCFGAVCLHALGSTWPPFLLGTASDLPLGALVGLHYDKPNTHIYAKSASLWLRATPAARPLAQPWQEAAAQLRGTTCGNC